MESRIINIRVNAEDLKFIDRQAERAGMSRPAFIRQQLGLHPVPNGGARPGAGRPRKLTTSEADPPTA